ncbi:MAG: SUMF1/EgtB/PvdO family nonheme iron enzyme [Deltaproteobacteria bacterium]|nr:SUMF1/EgtB/PvdO family nonheme iron enzyme [Deltaproteobacteria bacterium]
MGAALALTLVVLAAAAASSAVLGRGGPPLEVARQAAAGDAAAALRAPGSEQVLIRAGQLLRGSDAAEVARAQAQCRLEAGPDSCPDTLFADEMPAHRVALRDFWIDRTEVTAGAFLRCVGAGACRVAGQGGTRARAGAPDLPMTLVSWHDAVDYCRWAGGRLPTEAEWERAARGWSGRIYPWGQIYNRMVANHGRFGPDNVEHGAFVSLDASDGFAELAPVGSFPQGRTPEGLDDLAGNVEEWVADWYAPGYDAESTVDPRGPANGDQKVVRGGSYQSPRAWLRAAARGRVLPTERHAWRGFRCARDAVPGPVPARE